jgi:hypothetical protein
MDLNGRLTEPIPDVEYIEMDDEDQLVSEKDVCGMHRIRSTLMKKTNLGKDTGLSL